MSRVSTPKVYTLTEVEKLISRAFTTYCNAEEGYFRTMQVIPMVYNNKGDKAAISMVSDGEKINCGFHNRSMSVMRDSEFENLKAWCKSHPGCEIPGKFKFMGYKTDNKHELTLNIHFYPYKESTKPYFNFHVHTTKKTNDDD